MLSWLCTLLMLLECFFQAAQVPRPCVGAQGGCEALAVLRCLRQELCIPHQALRALPGPPFSTGKPFLLFSYCEG